MVILKDSYSCLFDLLFQEQANVDSGIKTLQEKSDAEKRNFLRMLSEGIKEFKMNCYTLLSG